MTYIKYFCNYIDNIIINNKIINNEDNYKLYYFTCVTQPDISISKYIEKIYKSEIIKKDNFDSIIIYTINLLKKLNTKNVYLNKYNCHRLILILLMLSCKIHEEYYYSNSCWANIGGVKLKEINVMEIIILKLLNYNLNINISKEKALSIYKSIY